jgi:peptidoglycan biosynthesis protein MviN/MurJ (putative lipid II flippase)
VLFNTLLGAVLNVGLNLHLIPAYGITGAAIGTSACFLLMAFLQTVEANIFLNFSSINARTMLKIAFSAGVSFFASSYLYKNLPEFIANNELLLMISVSLVFVIVYFAGLFILKSFDREDSAIFKTITAKAGTKQKPAKCEE